MKVVVTGGAGFIGSHLAESLIKNRKISKVLVIDHLLDGRFLFGIGPGGLPSDLEVFGNLEINKKLISTYSNLNSWQKTMVARHEDRPRANYYIKEIFENSKSFLSYS